MITTKIEKLQQMANFEGDVRDGNIGSFSQGVVVGERNASKLALEVLEEILNKSKSQVFSENIIHPNPTNEVRLIVNGANILIGSWRLEAVYPPSWFSSSSLCGYKFLCQIEDMSGLRLIEEKNSVIELVVSNERFPVLAFKVSFTPPIGHTFSGEFKKVESQVDKPKPSSWKPDSTKSQG
jgi:hypothetical protein